MKMVIESQSHELLLKLFSVLENAPKSQGKGSIVTLCPDGEPADPPQPEVPKMSLGPAYEDGGKWWQDVLNQGILMPRPAGSQFYADNGKWINCAGLQDGHFFYRNGTYRIPAKPPQTAPEAPASVPPALPITLTTESPEPPVGSVVLVGRYQQSYQRRHEGWWPAGGTIAHSWFRLIHDNDTVILIYAPPEPAHD